MKSIKGYSLVELLVSMAVASILVLTIGTISGMSRQSYNKALQEMNLYNDVFYGYKLLENRVREAKSMTIQAASGVWVSQRLILDHKHVFGLYQASGQPDINFVYVDDLNNVNDQKVLLSIPSGSTAALTFSVAPKSVIVSLSGTKLKIPFQLNGRIVRRS